MNYIRWTPRPISNKTRIETNVKKHFMSVLQNSQTDFQQNKDWNGLGDTPGGVLGGLPDRFPTKQGLKHRF